MEINKPLSGGLNTDDAFEVIPPEDYFDAANLVVGRSNKNKNGLGELMMGTNSLSSYVPLPFENEKLDSSLDGWTNKIVLQMSGSSNMSLAVANATMIAGTIANISGASSMNITHVANLTVNAGYSVDVQIKGSSATAYAVRVYYDIGGGWVQLGSQGVLTTSYAVRGTLPTLQHGQTVKIGITDDTDTDLAFGASFSPSGSFVGFNGKTSFFTSDPVTQTEVIYVRTYIVL